MPLSLILDIAVIALLVPTIIFAVILNNRLGVLRKNREELARLINAFNEATARAETGIPRLRKTVDETAKTLQEKGERAQTLRDDLAYMIERADEAVARLEGAVRLGRSEAKPTPPGFEASRLAAAATPEENAVRDAIKAASAVAGTGTPTRERGGEPVRERGGEKAAPLPLSASDRGLDIESLAAAAEREERATQGYGDPAPRGVSGASAPPLGAALAREATRESGSLSRGRVANAAASREDERSEAERELLRALRSVR